MFISPKRKNAIPEMALKSFILSKLDHKMSKSWKGIAAHELETKARKLSIWLLSSGQDFGKNLIASKHVLMVYFKPSRKNPDFFNFTTVLCACLTDNLPLKSRHLRRYHYKGLIGTKKQAQNKMSKAYWEICNKAKYTLTLWAYGVMEFQVLGYEIRIIGIWN